ncbi:MAG: potassium channel family protein [Candidatus Eremiobacteraeota bacterium]|nr:potassium channel family protein [Candidatus Eremiobacteraeota bacterium]
MKLSSQFRGKILYSQSRKSFYRTIILRLLFVLVIITITAILFYMHRGELKSEKPLNFWDIIYFTIISVTTVGYGDIVPHSSWTRLFDAFFVTFVRFFTWFLIISTAFELMVPRIMEAFMIKRLIARIKNHILICGFGRIGREVLDTLLQKGENPKQIVVIDAEEEKSELAAEKGVTGLRGDAENEEILTIADIVNARKIFICANQDHTNLMICLTARSMNENVEIITVAREKENVKLFKRAGADYIISLPELLSQEMVDADLMDSVGRKAEPGETKGSKTRRIEDDE